MGFAKPGRHDTGYGSRDKGMSKQLRKADGKEEADRIARRNGLKDAEDARKWLQERKR